MSVRVYLVMILVSIVQISFTQFNDSKERLLEVLDGEINHLEKKEKQKLFIISQKEEELPYWFYQIPTGSSETFFAIGISDPYMRDSLMAVEQAFSRAMFQVGLMNGVLIKGLSDMYYDGNGLKYEEIFKCIGSKKIYGKGFVMDSFKTQYEEKVLLVQFDISASDSMNLEAFIDVYKSSTKTDYGWQSYENMTSHISFDTTSFASQYLSFGDDFSARSIKNDSVRNIPEGLYEYVNDLSNKEDTLSKDLVVKLHHKGLWVGYIQAFVDGISMLAANQNSVMKNINQVYDFGISDLSRNIISDNIKFNIYNISSLDGNLVVNLSKQ